VLAATSRLETSDACFTTNVGLSPEFPFRPITFSEILTRLKPELFRNNHQKELKLSFQGLPAAFLINLSLNIFCHNSCGTSSENKFVRPNVETLRSKNKFCARRK
jgi:hypothetical protein